MSESLSWYCVSVIGLCYILCMLQHFVYGAVFSIHSVCDKWLAEQCSLQYGRTFGNRNKLEYSTLRLFPALSRLKNPRKLCLAGAFEVFGEKHPDLPDRRFLRHIINKYMHVKSFITFYDICTCGFCQNDLVTHTTATPGHATLLWPLWQPILTSYDSYRR